MTYKQWNSEEVFMIQKMARKPPKSVKMNIDRNFFSYKQQQTTTDEIVLDEKSRALQQAGSFYVDYGFGYPDSDLEEAQDLGGWLYSVNRKQYVWPHEGWIDDIRSEDIRIPIGATKKALEILKKAFPHDTFMVLTP